MNAQTIINLEIGFITLLMIFTCTFFFAYWLWVAVSEAISERKNKAFKASFVGPMWRKETAYERQTKANAKHRETMAQLEADTQRLKDNFKKGLYTTPTSV